MRKSQQSAAELIRKGKCWRGRFTAMGGPCELLLSTDSVAQADALFVLAREEALRVEQKYSRYRQDNIVYTINHSMGRRVTVDSETARLLDYADSCYKLSDGLFDITSGVLREIWRFDGSDRIAQPDQIERLLPRIGWDKVTWENPGLILPHGMEIDFGGIGKEYAVDSSANILRQHVGEGVLINYGGDLCALGPLRDNSPWNIAVDNPKASGRKAIGTIVLHRGAIATSGDARRYLLKDGKRYGHILNPRTGWPVADAPRSVTVMAPTCLEAGMLATFAVLHGARAEAFMQDQHVPFWIQR